MWTDFSQGSPDRLLDLRVNLGPPKSLAVRLCSGQSGPNPFPDDGSLKLREDTAHLEHGFASGRGCVYALLMQVQVDFLALFPSFCAEKRLQNRLFLCHIYL